MTNTEPGIATLLPTTPVDFAAIYAQQAEAEARAADLRPANKDRLFEALVAVGITHVTVTFDGSGDSGQVESIGAWCGDVAAAFPSLQIQFAALTWDKPEVEMRSLTLSAVVEEMAYDFLADTHCGWENDGGAYGEFCFDAAARTIHLEYNERFTSYESYDHDF